MRERGCGGGGTFNTLKCVIPLIVLSHLKENINQNLITIPLTFNLKPSISLRSSLLCDSWISITSNLPPPHPPPPKGTSSRKTTFIKREKRALLQDHIQQSKTFVFTHLINHFWIGGFKQLCQWLQQQGKTSIFSHPLPPLTHTHTHAEGFLHRTSSPQSRPAFALQRH